MSVVLLLDEDTLWASAYHNYMVGFHLFTAYHIHGWIPKNKVDKQGGQGHKCNGVFFKKV